MRLLFVAVLVCAAGSAVVIDVSVARGQPDSPVPPNGGKGAAEPDAKALAREHFQKAKALHEQKKYAEAAVEYLEAYRHLPAPAFLYNVGQVYRLGGEKQKALEQYKKYLELEPQGEGAEDARQFIAELSAAIAAEENARRDAAVPTGDAIPPGGAGAPTRRDTGERPGRTLMVAGMVSGGIGVAALGAATVFAFKARSANSDLDGFRGEWGPSQEDRYASGEAAERNMTVSLVVGAAALAAGGTMYFIGRRKAKRADKPLSVGAGADGERALLLFGGSF